MKKTIKSITAVLLALMALICLFGCDRKAPEGIWESATYLEDVTLGEGSKTVTVKQIIQDKTVVFTIKTDAATLGEAMNAHNLLEGEDGLYTVINGVTADYNIDKSYWSFTKGGEYLMYGADDAEIADGEVYEFTYTK